MRKIDMKRKINRKEKSQNGDEANGDVDNIKLNEGKGSSDEATSNSENENSKNSEPKIKKKKPSKRKSSKKSKKESKKEKEDDELEKEEQNEEDDNDDDSVQYEVEKILDEKFVKGVRHYLIRWKGYEPESDSWEPESTLNCVELIKKFKAGRDDKGKDEPRSKKSKTKKSSSPKKSRESKVEVNWESDDEFEVDRILDVYFKRDGVREFLVSWKGYPTSAASWEPEGNLQCHDLITRFMNKVDKAKLVDQKELRVNRTPTKRFTLNMYSRSDGRRLSRRLDVKERVHYLES